MSTTLYRKYRPQLFADVIGQEHVTVTLQNQIRSGKLAHAYLFCGTRGVGKTSVARLLAKSLNCTQRAKGSAEPCNSCASCLGIAQGRSLDLIEIDAASNRRIDDVREIREHIPYGPSESAYKVVIIDEVHMLTTEAFNALLKTLEEPPAHVVFILATTEVHKLPDTITSRCQRFDFRPIPAPLLEKRLSTLAAAEGVSVASEVLASIAQLARGSTRDAESYLGKLVSLGEATVTEERANLVLPKFDTELCIDFLRRLSAHDAAGAVTLINDYLASGGELSHFHRQVLELLRQLMLYKISGAVAGAGLYTNPKVLSSLEEVSRNVTQARSRFMLERWLLATDSWRDAEIVQLPLELAAVEMAELAPSASTVNPTPAAGGELAAPSNPRVQKPNMADLGSGDSAALLAKLQERWAEVVAKLREFNHSLSFILSIARPATLESNTLTIAFQYQLHLDRVHDSKVREAISQALRDVVGADLTVRGTLEPAPVGGDLLANVLTTFGGQVVS